jgi:hypothetical protein
MALASSGPKLVIKHDVTVKRFVNHGDLVIDGGNVSVASAASG